MESAKKTKEKEVSFELLTNKENLSVDEIIELRKEMLLTLKARRQVISMLDELEASKKKVFASQVKELARKGVICWMLDRTEDAIKYLKDVDSVEGTSYFLGLCYFDIGQNEKAYKLFAEAYKESPQSAHVVVSYFESLVKLGKIEDVAALIQKVKDKFSNHPMLPYFRGVYSELQGEYQKAREEYESAVAIDGNYAPALFKLAYRLNLEGKDAEALEIYKKLYQIKPPHINTLINLGILYEDSGDYQKALECYERVLEFYPNHQRAGLFADDSRSSLGMFYDDSYKRKEQELKRLLGQPISEFQIPTRAQNCLESLSIKTIGDLVRKTENDLITCENFGRKTLTDIKELLARRGLTLSTESKTVTVESLLKSYISTEEPQKTDDVLNKPIFEIDWSARVRGSLTRLKVYTVGDLANKSEKDFMDLPNFGQTSLDEIKRRLSQLALSLKQID